MTGLDQPAHLTLPPAPHTEVPQIDAALAALTLSWPTAVLGDHHNRLAEVHAVLHEALNADSPPVTT